MAGKTKIEWAEARWNPVRVRLVGPDGAALTRPDPKTGEVRSWWGYHCEHVSPGCEHCYAETLNKRGFPAFGTLLDYKPGLIDGPLPPAVWGRLGVPHGSRLELYLDEDELRAPLRWRKPRTIFVCSMTDLFARFVPDAMIDRVFAVMAMAPQHTFQVLTKRAEAMRAYLSRGPLPRRRWEAVIREAMGRKTVSPAPRLRNVWLGVSVEDQRRADDRRAPLAALAAAGWPTWVSYEPALGPVDWANWAFIRCLISGGESGAAARPSHPDWHRGARDWCAAHGVDYGFKQWGEWAPPRGLVGNERTKCHWFDARTAFDAPPDMMRVGKKRAGRLLDECTHDGAPGAPAGGA